MDSNENIKLYRNLFKWRQDVYAYRREKDGKSWYSPAYDFNWYKFNIHKNQWWTISTFEDKTLKQLTDDIILSHLNWKKVIWIYPLLQDNTSNFLVADFDDESWQEDSKNFLNTCFKYNIPAYLERSRSGNWAHVWIFFETSLLAVRSRKLFLKLIQESFWVEKITKWKSFDRIFPNQDFLSKKWFWNLIALPLQWESLKIWNSVFLDPNILIPYENQWAFLSWIEKLSESDFNVLYKDIVEKDFVNSFIGQTAITEDKQKLHVKIKDKIYLNKSEVSLQLYNFLDDALNILNKEYLIKKKLWKSVYNTDKYFKCLSENSQNIIVPRWFLSELEKFCKDNNITYEIQSEIKKHKSIKYSNNISLYTHQLECITVAYHKDCGVVVAPPWSGKTVMALDLIAKKWKKSLIIVHRQQLFEQWIDRIEIFLWIKKKEIWQIRWWKCKIWDKITLWMIQTISKIEDSEIFLDFWTIIVDECHHIPAKTFRKGIWNFTAEYFFWFTATPQRKYGDEALIFAYLWPIISEIWWNLLHNLQKKNEIIIKNSDIFLPFNYKNDDAQLLSKTIVFDTNRNNLIVNDILQQVKLWRKIITLTERKDHIDILNLYLKSQCEVICLSGKDSMTSRNLKMQQIKNGEFQVLLTTGQLLWEWLDISNLDTLFLIYPFSFEWKLIQYIWRLQRWNTESRIYDYRDNKISYLEKMFKKRLIYYKKLQKESWYELIMDWEVKLF